MHARKIACLSLLLACQPSTPTIEPEPAELVQASVPAPVAELPGMALEREGHRLDIVDIVLSPDASAALSVDRNGGVRLWPTIDGTHEPLLVPIDDPNQLSLARTETGFTIATLDTIGGAEVYEVRSHDGELRIDPKFSIPPTDPLFELHVLEGGQRLLALGVDHRVRLYDANGAELSGISEHGFVPWQLRHVETPDGVALVAIIAGPTRVQPLELRGDQLRIVGEAFPVELDRGPNRNDLALTPDGTHIAAFSRRKWRNGEWQLRLHALADGSERLIEGKLDTKPRPRVHLLDGQRMLLDDGSGVGQMISLDPASPGAATTRALPGSSEPVRLFTSVEQGVRVVPSGHHFVVDRLGGEEHVRIGREPVEIFGAGFSPDGSRVIWAFEDGWAIEPIDGDGTDMPKIHAHTEWPLRAADFVDDERVVLVAQGGMIELVDATSAEVLASTLAPELLAFQRDVTEARLARGETPMLLVRDDGAQRHILLELGLDGIRESASVPAEQFIGPGYPTQTPKMWTSMAWKDANRWQSRSQSETSLEVDLAGRISGRRTTDIRDMVTLPDGARVFLEGSGAAMLIRTRPKADTHVGKVVLDRELDYYATRLSASPTGDLLATSSGHGIAVYDALTLERQWIRPDVTVAALSWSADGERLVVGGSRGGAVYDAATGELAFERHDFGLYVERARNAMPEPALEQTR